MIGLALVTLVAVLAAGITTSFRGAVNDLWTRRLRDHGEDNFSPIPIAAGERRGEDAGRARRSRTCAAATRRCSARRSRRPASTREAVGIFNLDWVEGSDARHRGARRRTARSSTTATRRTTTSTVGSPLDAALAERRASRRSRCSGIFDPPDRRLAVRPRDDLAPRPGIALYDDPENIFSFVQHAGRRDGREPGRARAAARSRSRTRRCRRSRSSSTTRSAG